MESVHCRRVGNRDNRRWGFISSVFGATPKRRQLELTRRLSQTTRLYNLLESICLDSDNG
jgi:hypothetical protein